MYDLLLEISYRGNASREEVFRFMGMTDDDVNELLHCCLKKGDLTRRPMGYGNRFVLAKELKSSDLSDTDRVLVTLEWLLASNPILKESKVPMVIELFGGEVNGRIR